MKLRISMLYLLLYLGMGSFMPFMSLFLHERGFNGSSIGLILAVGSLTGILAQPIIGIINDLAKDYRTLIKISSFLSAIIALAFMFSYGVIPILITAIIFYFINSPLGPIVDAMAVEKGPVFGFTYGQVRLYGALGFALVTVVAGYVYSAIGYQFIFIAYAFFTLLMFLMIFTLPKMERPEQHQALGKDALGSLLSNGYFILFIFIAMLIAMAVTMNFSYLPIYFEKLHYPENLIGWNFTIAALIEIPLFWVSSKAIRRMGLFPMITLGTIFYALKYFLMGFAPPVGVVLGLQALDGIAFAFYQSAAVEIVNLMAPKQVKATAQTVFAAAGGAAGIIGNAVGGIVVDHAGPQFLFWLMAGIVCFSVILFIVFPSKRKFSLDSIETAGAPSVNSHSLSEGS